MMVLSIMALGVLEPIMVYRRPDTTFEVIAGRRRTRHAREANKRLVLLGEAPIKVPVVVKAARISREMASVIDTTLNEHRENDPPSVKIRKAAKLLARGIDISTVAVAYRVTVATIKHWIEAATAHPIVGAALDARIVTIDAVAALSSMTHEEQPRALDQLLARPEARPALVRAVRDRKPLPGRVPRGAVRWILAEPGAFSEDFIRGVKFMKGELSEEEVRAIMAKIGR
jgi:ParB family chromosome partitioning protein